MPDEEDVDDDTRPLPALACEAEDEGWKAPETAAAEAAEPGPLAPATDAEELPALELE